MSNGRKRLRGAFAASILLAASMAAAPAPAQTGGGGEANNYYSCIDANSGSAGGSYGNGYGYGSGYGCCQYDVYSGGWYIMYASHWEPCPPPPYQSPDQSTDRASEEPTQ